MSWTGAPGRGRRPPSSIWRWASRHPAPGRRAGAAGAGAGTTSGLYGGAWPAGVRRGDRGLYRRQARLDLIRRGSITPGSSGGFILAFSALFDAGDRVALGSRAIPAIARSCAPCRRSPGIPTRPEDRYQPRPGTCPDDVQADPGPRRAIPGTVLRRDELAALTGPRGGTGDQRHLRRDLYHGLDYGAGFSFRA